MRPLTQKGRSPTRIAVSANPNLSKLQVPQPIPKEKVKGEEKVTNAREALPSANPLLHDWKPSTNTNPISSPKDFVSDTTSANALAPTANTSTRSFRFEHSAPHLALSLLVNNKDPRGVEALLLPVLRCHKRRSTSESLNRALTSLRESAILRTDATTVIPRPSDKEW